MKDTPRNRPPQGEPDRSALGLTFKQIPDIVLTLPVAQRPAAVETWAALGYFVRRGARELTTTDRALMDCPFLAGRSLRFARKGLETLAGLGLIERSYRSGVRTITIAAELRRAKPVAKQAPAPPPRLIAFQAPEEPFIPTSDWLNYQAIAASMH